MIICGVLKNKNPSKEAARVIGELHPAHLRDCAGERGGPEAGQT